MKLKNMPPHLNGKRVEIIQQVDNDETGIPTITVRLLESAGPVYPVGTEIDVAPYEIEKRPERANRFVAQKGDFTIRPATAKDKKQLRTRENG